MTRLAKDLPREEKKAFETAWIAAREGVFGKPASSGLYGLPESKKLAVLLGLEYENEGDWSKLPSNLFEILRQLSGPHGKAILATYRIQKGLD